MLPQYPPQQHPHPHRPHGSNGIIGGDGPPGALGDYRSLSSSSVPQLLGRDADKPASPYRPSADSGSLQRRNTYTPNGSSLQHAGPSGSGYGADQGEDPDVKPNTKKRSRRPSPLPINQGGSSSQHGNGNGKTEATSSSKKTKPAAGGESPPAVLIREKKQKACSNCRRAKLKCIVDDGETDCVRCKARKERCVFYPRGHDEDWQQTLTADVYSAISQLSSLSSAVQHIVHHLTAQRIIPPLPPPGLEPYEAPDRDMSFLQGWNAERNRELGASTSKRKKGSNGRDSEEDEAHPTNSSTGWNSNPGDTPFSHHRGLSIPIDRPPWTPGMGSMPFPHDGPPPPPPPHPFMSHPGQYPFPSPGFPQQRAGSITELPPIRPQTSGPVHLTPTHELDISPVLGYQHPQYMGPGGPFPSTPLVEGRMPPPPPPPHPPQIHRSGSAAPPQRKDLSPLNGQNATPNSVVNSSPSTQNASQTTPGRWSFGGSQGNEQNPLNGLSNSQPGPGLFDGSDIPDNSFNPIASNQPSGNEEVYGSADGRETVITKNIVPPSAARTLVEFFHSNMSPFLFGYHLQLRAFPYLPEGPTHITPFILAVECLLAAERIPALYSYHERLADAVLNMLMTSPAESWQTIQGSREIREAKNKEQVLGKALDSETTDWDAELGIGPEEIVAACVLASFIGQKEHARHIAQYAFMWARGWTAYLKQPGATFAEATGLVTPLRRPSEPDMARVWLLCFIVAGQENLQAPDTEIEPRHDPNRWSRGLVPENRTSTDDINPYDIILVFHARLIALLLEWKESRAQISQRSPLNASNPSLPSQSGSGGSNNDPSYDPTASPSYAHKRLASRLNAALDWWQDDLKSYRLDEIWTRQIQLDYLNAKVMVNSVASKNIWGGPDEDRLREANRSFAVDAGFQLLRRCMTWQPPESVTNLPQVYLRMIALAASEVVEALADVQNGSFSSVACPVTIKEVTPVLAALGNMLFLGGLQPGHGCRTAGHVLRQHVENMNRLIMP